MHDPTEDMQDLASQCRAELQSQGFAVVKNFLTEGELDELRMEADTLYELAQEGERLGPAAAADGGAPRWAGDAVRSCIFETLPGHQCTPVLRSDPAAYQTYRTRWPLRAAVWRLLFASRLSCLVLHVLGPGAVLFNDQYIIKPPAGDGADAASSSFAWHRDSDWCSSKGVLYQPYISLHYFVEMNVCTMLESDMEHAYLTDSNAGMTSTDTQKNMVYYVAKQFSTPCSPEEFGLALAQQFVRAYPQTMWKAKVMVEVMPWKRIDLGGQPHDHGFTMQGTEVRTAYVTYDNQGRAEITGGFKDLKVLKTTQSGYSGFAHDKYTMLPDVGERIVASAVTASWRYSRPPSNYDAAYAAVKTAFSEAFYGPVKGGVFSPSVQYTLFRMAKGALASVPEAESVFMNMPNLHFIPVAPVTTTFNHDVYVATSEPHGNIEAVVTRSTAQPHCRL